MDNVLSMFCYSARLNYSLDYYNTKPNSDTHNSDFKPDRDTYLQTRL